MVDNNEMKKFELVKQFPSRLIPFDGKLEYVNLFLHLVILALILQKINNTIDYGMKYVCNHFYNLTTSILKDMNN